MRFHFPERIDEYAAIRSGIERSGYLARTVALGGAQDGLQITAQGFLKGDTFFSVYSRSRGVFVRYKNKVCYLVRQREHALEICLQLLIAGELHERVFDRLAVAGELAEVSLVQWSQDEIAELRRNWKEFGFEALDRADSQIAWNRFNEWFTQNVRVFRGELYVDFPAMIWNLDRFDCLVNEDIELDEIGIAEIKAKSMQLEAEADSLEAELTVKLLRALAICDRRTFPLFAIDRLHACYLFDPQKAIPTATRNYWAVPFMPRDNSYYFMALDYSYGIIGVYSPKRLIVFGEPLTCKFGLDLPQGLISACNRDWRTHR